MSYLPSIRIWIPLNPFVWTDFCRQLIVQKTSTAGKVQQKTFTHGVVNIPTWLMQAIRLVRFRAPKGESAG